ncbi:MAG TPA: phosphatase PAP2 family protein [Myxococcales bacterium]
MIVALLLVAAPWTDAGPGDKLAIRPALDFTILGVGLLGFVVPELLKQHLAPASCNVCNGPDNTGLGDGSQGSLNGVDAFFHDQLTGWLISRKSADTVSNVWAFALLPAGAIAGSLLATGPTASEWAGLRAAVIVGESAAVSAAMVQSMKFFVARKRPFVRYGNGETSGAYDVNDRDSHVSYPSGHTALATSLGVSMAMTATLEESPAAPWLWGAAAVMSVSTATLRMIAEKHYFTDVAAGAAIGAACGVVFPVLHKRGNALSVTAQASAPLLVLSGAF